MYQLKIIYALLRHNHEYKISYNMGIMMCCREDTREQKANMNTFQAGAPVAGEKSTPAGEVVMYSKPKPEKDDLSKYEMDDNAEVPPETLSEMEKGRSLVRRNRSTDPE